jgi:DhnA family fructose-bisphosphate aldolase class Ia
MELQMSFQFNINDFMPRRILDAITEIRVTRPEVIAEQAAARRKRTRLTRDGKLVILACDHPQRGVTQSGNDPLIMGNRQEYLGRALRIITDPSLDGVMAPPDFIEDLFIVDYLIQQGGGPSFLDERVLIGCMQRGGVAGVVGEINDRFGAYSPESIAAERLDGGKMMYRFITDDEGTLYTIDYCSRAVTELHRRNVFAFVEPLPQENVDGKYRGNASVPVLVKLVSVSAALGESSQHTWLKIPYVDGYEQVALATTLPILMLGGESAGDIQPTLRNFEKGMHAGASVRGAMIGRNILFPGQADPLAAALAVNAVVHHGASADKALAQIQKDEGKAFDALTRWIK